MSSSEIPAIVVMLGDESALMDDAVASLKSRVVPGAAASFNAAVFRAGEGVSGAVAQAQTQPMMSRYRFVEVRELENASSEDLEQLLRYLEAPSPSTVFVMRGTKLGNTKLARSFQASAKRAGVLQTFRSRDQNPASLARARVEAAGCRIETSALRRLIELTGTNTAQLRMEVDKLVCAIGGTGVIGIDVVESACSLVAEAVAWELTDAIVARDGGRAMVACERLLGGGGGAQRSAHQLIGTVAWQMRDLLALQAALRAGKPPPGRWSRMPSHKLRAATETIRRRPIDPARVTAQLARASTALNRARSDDQFVFESLILAMTEAD